MNKINQIISKNLKKIRKQKEITIQELAGSSTISSVSLNNIENGKSNPTIDTLWKIADALNVPYTELLLEQTIPEATVVSYDQVMQQAQFSKDEKSKVYLYYPLSQMDHYEFFGMEIISLSEYTSPGHLAGSREYIFVLSGVLEVKIGSDTYHLNQGDSLTFFSDRPHTYFNREQNLLKLLIMNRYKDI